MGDGALGALITAAGLFVSGGFAYLLKRKPRRVDDYEQLQEDLAALRSEFRQYKADAARDKADQARENDYHRAVIVHLDNEVMDLRQGMATAGVRLQPRKPYPPHPAGYLKT